MEIKHVEGRFYISTPGGDAELLYRIDGGVMDIYHTFVPETERHKGIAAKLTDEALAFAKAQKLEVRMTCSYVQHHAKPSDDSGEAHA